MLTPCDVIGRLLQFPCLSQPSTKHPHSFAIETEARIYFLQADTAAEREEWAAAVVNAVARATSGQAVVHAVAPAQADRASPPSQPTAHAADDGGEAVFSGFLVKSPTIAKVDEITPKRWQRRWFELRGGHLVYFVEPDKESGERGRIDLSVVTDLYLEQVIHSCRTQLAYLDRLCSVNHHLWFCYHSLAHYRSGGPPQPSSKHKFAFTIATTERTYFLKAETADERAAWTAAVETAVMSVTHGKATVHPSAPVAPVKFGEQPPPLTSDVDPDFCGFLVKAPTIHKVDEVTHKRWQRRWFVLKGRFLYYFTGADRSDMKGAIDITTCMGLAPHIPSSKRRCVFSLQCDDREYFMQAEDDNVREGWIGALVDAAQAAGGTVPDAEAAEVEEPEEEPAPYTGQRTFAVQFEGNPGLLEVKPPRLNLVQKVVRQTRQGPHVVQATTNTWPLAQLWHSGYKEDGNIFSFEGGQLDEVPGKIYRFQLRPGTVHHPASVSS